MLISFLANIPPLITMTPSTIQGAMVGSSLIIECLAMTNVTVSVDSVEVDWIAPNGSSIVNNSRLTITPTDAQNSNYTSMLQFDYLMEGDEGNYTCNVTTSIFNVSGVRTTVMQSLNSKYSRDGTINFLFLSHVVPVPTVSVVALSNQTVGQSLMLECNVTTVRGVTSELNIMWNVSNGTVIKTTNNVNPSSTSTTLVYTDIYTISLLGVNDDEEVYVCEAVINTTSQIMVDDNITLDVTSE